MSDTICSNPKCQTTAGCQCHPSEFPYPEFPEYPPDHTFLSGLKRSDSEPRKLDNESAIDAFRAGQQDILRRLREICSGNLEWIEDRIALRRRECWEATPALDDISDIDTARVALTAAADAIEKEVAGE